MHFSCKITSSVLTYFESQGRDTSFIYDDPHLPHEFLRDSSSWIKAEQAEFFLNHAYKVYGDLNLSLEAFLEKVGHSAPQLRAWGVLDSVLRMMNSPREILSQPQKFFSYFVSPEPPVENIRWDDESVNFDLPIMADQYPAVTTYLRHAIEALPTYVGKPLLRAEWHENHFSTSWIEVQNSLFVEEESARKISPDLMRSIISSLESSQRELEERNRQLLEKNFELEKAKYELEKHMMEKIYSEKLSGLAELASALAHEINTPIAYVNSNVMRLQDYFNRAQQLITLLIGQDRLTPPIQHAMKKVDWEWIQTQVPDLVKETGGGLWRIREIVRDLSFLSNSSKGNDKKMVPTDINQLVESVLRLVSPNIPTGIRVEKSLLVQQMVDLYPTRFEQALVNIINNAIAAVGDSGTIRISTVEHGEWVHVEVADTGEGMDEETLKNIFTPFYTTRSAGKGTGLGLSIAHSIIMMHEGKVAVDSKKGQGTAFTIQLTRSKS